MPIIYNGHEIGKRRVDFFVEGKVMVEIKACIRIRRCAYSTGHELLPGL